MNWLAGGRAHPRAPLASLFPTVTGRVPGGACQLPSAGNGRSGVECIRMVTVSCGERPAPVTRHLGEDFS
jgi:hypothetical protein